jgi:imidazolonepropionase-like amidohydrolase
VEAPVTVIEGATLIDGNGGAPLKNSAIVIEGSRIKAVGPKGAVTYPAGARIINAEGLTALPGLIDAHIHALNFFPPLFLRFGVTTVMDTANPTAWIIAQREALKSGRIKGPRMFVTGDVIDGPDEEADERREGYRVNVHTPEEARDTARKMLEQGVDALKVYQHLTPELLKPIVEEAHKADTEAVGHSHDAKDAVLAGLKFIEHTTPIAHATLGDAAKVKALDENRLRTPEADMNPALFGALIDLMVKNGVFFNPTITRSWINALPKRAQWNKEAADLIDSPPYRLIPAARREFWLKAARDTRMPDPRVVEGLKRLQEFTRRYAQAGGRIITGPDSGPSSGPANLAGLAMHVEMEALVDAGVTPMQAIQASTKWPAELMHKQQDLGTIAPGRIADVVLIEGDPLADIRTTRRIRTVMMNGQTVDTTLDPNFRNPIPRPVSEYDMDKKQDETEPDATVRKVVERLDLERYKATIKALTQFGDRRQGTERNRKANDWIEAQLHGYGCPAERVSYEYTTPPPNPNAGRGGQPPEPVIASGEIRRGQGGSRLRGTTRQTGVNNDAEKQPDARLRELNAEAAVDGTRQEVYCTKVGATHPDEMYIVGAHMDGHGWGEAANDNASGTALVMELARIFSMPDVQTERSIRFILWNNEETGLNGARAYVEQRAGLQGQENPPGSGRYPEPMWLGMIQHDMMLWDHGMPRADGTWNPEQRPEADVNIEFQATAKLADAAMKLAFFFRAANEKFATDYPAAVGPHMTNTDSTAFMNFVPSISLRENERGMHTGGGWNPTWHQPIDVFTTFSDKDFRLGLNAAQTTGGAIALLTGAQLVE